MLFLNSVLATSVRAVWVCALVLVCAAGTQAQTPLPPDLLGTAPLTGDLASPRNNTVNYGMNVTSSYDDDAPGIVSTSNVAATIEPQLGLVLQRAHLNSNFFYQPGFTYNNKLTGYNSLSHAAGLDFQYLLSKRLSIRVRDAFILTNNPFESVQANAELPSLGILDRPNPSAIGANLRSSTNTAGADLIYLLGPHTSVGVGGAFSNLRYETLTSRPGTNSFDTQSWSGHAFYTHQLTPRYSLSMEYSAQNFSAQSGMFSILTHEVLGFWAVSFKNKMQLTVFAGPQFSLINDAPGAAAVVPGNNMKSSFSGGTTFSWQGQHSGMSASFVQQISDAGASGGAAVDTRIVNLQVQRQLRPRLSVNSFGNYVTNGQLDPLSTFNLPDTASIGLGFTYALSPHVNMNLSAFHQQFFGSAPQLVTQRSHEVASISLSYRFGRPLGR